MTDPKKQKTDTDNALTPWHRLLGLALCDYFEGTCFTVEVEKDLSLKQQLLDILIIEKVEGRYPQELLTGFDSLGEHNLITFKSGSDTLDDFAMLELVAHYINYCKVLGRERMMDPEADRLYALTVRYPKNLEQVLELTQIASGVYQTRVVGLLITVIVLGEIPPTQHDALWNLFSLKAEHVLYGRDHYHWKPGNRINIISKLFQRYSQEGVAMYTMEDLKRENLESFTFQERLEGIPPHTRLEGIPPHILRENMTNEDRLDGIPPELILEYLRKNFPKVQLKKQEDDQ